jgi:serine/threonine protein kinase
MALDPQRLKELFLHAAEIESPADRAAFLDRECDDGSELRRKLEALLHAHDDSGGFLALAPTVDPAPADANSTRDLGGETVGDVIGPYKLLQLIGEGGMGAVFFAEQTRPVQRKVALKIIKPGMDSRQVIARFEAERQALALMDHPNIAKVLDAGCTTTGRPYFVMEMVKGTPITTYCDEQRLPLSRRLELFISLCQAIQHAHQKGIIHRDIKPSNVLVAPYDGKPVVKVIDFGIAKAMGPKLTEKTLFTEFGAVVGTLQYMSPEQAELNNLDIDTRSDIYSLGVLLYELLTGTTPLDPKQMQDVAFAAILKHIQEQEPPRPSVRLSALKESLPSISALRQTEPGKLTRLVRGDLDWIVMKALAKERERRYGTASGLAADVERFQRVEPIEARPPSVGYRLRKYVRRHKDGVKATAAICLVAGFVALAAYSMIRTQDKASEEDSELRMENMELLNFLEFQVLRGPELQNPNRTLREALDQASENVAVYCHDHPRPEARARQILGVAYMDMGADRPAEIQLTKAVQLYRQVRDLRLGSRLFDEGNYLSTMSSLASLDAWQKRFDEEEPLRVEVVEYYRHQSSKSARIILGKNSACALFCLGNCYRHQARWQQAEALFAEAIQECRGLETARYSILNKEYLLARSLAEHARCLLARNAFAEAEDESRECVSLMNRESHDSLERANDALLANALIGQRNPDSLDRVNVDSLLADALIGQRKYAEAEQLLLAGYERMKQQKDKARLTEAFKRLVQLYEATGNKDEAAKWRKELGEVKKSASKKMLNHSLVVCGSFRPCGGDLRC